MSIHFGKEQWMKVSRWGLLLGCWLLIMCLQGNSTHSAYNWTFLKLGPEKIVGARNVIYCEAPGYLYTNPGAMIGLHLHCMAWKYLTLFLATFMGTALFGTYKVLSMRKVWAKTLQIIFWCVMFTTLLFLAVVCVWEWSLAWIMLILFVRFVPRWSIKSRFTLMALIAAIVILGWQRMELVSLKRQFDSFWNSAERCVTMEQCVQSFGKPVIVCRHIPEEEKEWFYKLANFDASLWLPGKTLAGFISQQMPDILLLPWFDDDGNRIAFAWCDLNPERHEVLAKKQNMQISQDK